MGKSNFECLILYVQTMKINKKCKLVIDVTDLMDVFRDMKITVSDVSGDTKPYIHDVKI